MYLICIFPLLKQALKLFRHCFQINVAISKNISKVNSPNYAWSVFVWQYTKGRTKKIGKWKREDRDKRENVVACVTKYGEREQLGGHDNYGLIYDSVSVKLGFTGCHRDTFWKIPAKLFIHNIKCYCPQFLFSRGWCTPLIRRAEDCICKHGSILNSLHAQVSMYVFVRYLRCICGSIRAAGVTAIASIKISLLVFRNNCVQLSFCSWGQWLDISQENCPEACRW